MAGGRPTTRTVQSAPRPRATDIPLPSVALDLRWDTGTGASGPFEVLPDHAADWQWPPPDPHVVPDTAKARIEVRARDASAVPDGTQATVEVCHVSGEAPIGPAIACVFQGGQLRAATPAAGETDPRPLWVFADTPQHRLYDPWDTPFYWFRVRAPSLGNLTADLPHAAGAPQLLRLKYLHVLMADAIADAGGLHTRQETGQLQTALSAGSRFALSKAFSRSGPPPAMQVQIAGRDQYGPIASYERSQLANIAVSNPSLAGWARVLANSFSYHHASHGDVLCGVDDDSTNAMRASSPCLTENTGATPQPRVPIRFQGNSPHRPPPPGTERRRRTDDLPDWCFRDPACASAAHDMPDDAQGLALRGARTHFGRSAFMLGNSLFSGPGIRNTTAVPAVPRALVFLNICVAGWDSGPHATPPGTADAEKLSQAFLARGARYFLAFQMYIPDTEAVTRAQQFYQAWCGSENGNPDAIPRVFEQVYAAARTTMAPILVSSAGVAEAGAGAAITGTVAVGAGPPVPR